MFRHLGDKLGDAGFDRIRIGGLVGSALPQFRRPATEFALLFHEGRVIAGFRGLQRRRKSGHAATDDQNASVLAFVRSTFGQLHFFYFGAAHAHIVIRHLLGDFLRVGALGLAPDHAFTNVGARHRNVLKIERLGLGAA